MIMRDVEVFCNGKQLVEGRDYDLEGDGITFRNIHHYRGARPRIPVWPFSKIRWLQIPADRIDVHYTVRGEK